VRISRQVVAIVVVAILIVAGLVERDLGTENAIERSATVAAPAADLAALGPVRLINNSYTAAMTFDCSTDTGVLRGSISIEDMLADPNGVDLVGATPTPNTNWTANGEDFSNGTVTWTWINFSGSPCVGANNPAGVVDLTLSNGDHYVVTINANPT